MVDTEGFVVMFGCYYKKLIWFTLLMGKMEAEEFPRAAASQSWAQRAAALNSCPSGHKANVS